MYARINEFTWTNWTNDETEDAFVQWRDLIQGQPGFRGYLILDKGNRQEIAITLWDTREAHQAWVSNKTFRALLDTETKPRIENWKAAEALVVRAELRSLTT